MPKPKSIQQSLIVNDASGMSAMYVRQVVRVCSEEDCVAAVMKANKEGWSVSIAGSRHSMGGQCIVEGR